MKNERPDGQTLQQLLERTLQCSLGAGDARAIPPALVAGGSPVVVGEVLETQDPLRPERVLVRWFASLDEEQAAWLQYERHLDPRPGDRVLVTLPFGWAEWLLTGVLGHAPRGLRDPAAIRRTPGASVPAPEVDVSAREPDVSGSVPDASAPVPDVSGSVPDVSAPVPDVSGSVPEVCTAVPDVSRSVPGAGAAEPDVSGSVPEVSAAEPDVSGSVPGAGAPVRDVSAAEPDVSGSMPVPGVSAAEPDVSGSVPGAGASAPEASVPSPEVGVPSPELPVPAGTDAPDAVLRLQPGQRIVILGHEGEPLLRVHQGADGPVFELARDRVELKAPHHLRLSAGSIELAAGSGGVDIQTEGDAVIRGKSIRLN